MSKERAGVGVCYSSVASLEKSRVVLLGIIPPVVWLSFSICCFTQSMAATSLLAVVVQDGIYLAADGKITPAGDVSPDSPTETCKIRQTGKYFFMAAGIADDQRTGFDLFKIAANALSAKTGSLMDKIANFDVMLEPKLAESVAHIRSDFPAEYGAVLQGKEVSNIFATWEDGRPLLVRDSWGMTEAGKIFHTGVRRAGAGIDDNFVMVVSDEGARKHWETHTELRTTHPFILFPLLLQIEMDRARIDSSVLSGPPIAVLSIKQSGAVWSQRGRCPDIAPY